MGIPGLRDTLGYFGYAPVPEMIAPGGSIIFVDAPQLVYRHHCSVSESYLPDDWNILFKNKSVALKSVTTSFSDQLKVPDGVYTPDGVNMDMLMPGPEEEGAPWVVVRSAIVERIAQTMADYTNANVVPILVWDPWVLGGARNEHKIKRPHVPLLIRRPDFTWIYAALKALGVPTHVANTEGEKYCAASMIGGYGDALITTDADAIILGAHTIATGHVKATIGQGLIMKNVDRAFRALEALTPKNVQPDNRNLLDLALYLGCDFFPRRRNNGPATAAKRIAAGQSTYYTELLNDQSVEGITRLNEANIAVELMSITPTEAAEAAATLKEAVAQAQYDPERLEALGATAAVLQLYAQQLRGIALIRDTPSYARGIDQPTGESADTYATH